jgi:hypothetical protein
MFHLAPLALLHPVTEAFHDTSNAPAPCLEGTREQLISNIFTWFNNTDPSGEHVFWLNGLAGTGKSAVARTVADHAKEQGRLAATFFFSRNTVATRAPSAIIPTIVYQLALCLPSIRPLVCAALKSDPDVRSRGVAAQARTLLEPLSRTAISDGPFLVVLDALDECYMENGRQGGDAVPKLLDKFKSLGSIKFLITSRDEGPIRRIFDAFKSKVALHDIEKTIVQSDIQHYLEHSFAEVACDRKLAPPFPPAIDLGELVRRAGSLFVYAATVAKWISDPDDQPLVRLQQVLAKDEDEVTYQHKFLDDMYSEILAQAAKTSRNPRKHEYALKNVISTVVLLQEPVCASALAVLAGEKDRTSGLLSLLSAVLLVDESAPVRLFHPSFPEFIVSEERCHNGKFLVRDSEGHLHLAIQCLEVMNTHLRQNICDIKDPSLPNSKVERLQQTLERVAPAELRYACKYWHAHLRLANVISSSLVDGLGTFCTTHLLHWLELLSLLNELPTAQAAIRLSLTHFRVCTSLLGLMRVFRRLINYSHTQNIFKRVSLSCLPMQNNCFRSIVHLLTTVLYMSITVPQLRCQCAHYGKDKQPRVRAFLACDHQGPEVGSCMVLYSKDTRAVSILLLSRPMGDLLFPARVTTRCACGMQPRARSGTPCTVTKTRSILLPSHLTASPSFPARVTRQCACGMLARAQSNTPCTVTKTGSGLLPSHLTASPSFPARMTTQCACGMQPRARSGTPYTATPITSGLLPSHPTVSPLFRARMIRRCACGMQPRAQSVTSCMVTMAGSGLLASRLMASPSFPARGATRCACGMQPRARSDIPAQISIHPSLKLLMPSWHFRPTKLRAGSGVLPPAGLGSDCAGFPRSIEAINWRIMDKRCVSVQEMARSRSWTSRTSPFHTSSAM